MDGDGLHNCDPNGQKLGSSLHFRVERDMGLGSYPAVSLADARLKRDQNKRLLAEGIDPIEAAKVSA